MADNLPVVTEADLDDNLRDKLVAAGKAAASFIPFAGGPLGEILSVAIPGQRADRIAAYLRQLAQRVSEMDEDIRSDLTRNKDKIDLIEEGGIQSTRALSETRIEQIVEAVANGLSRHDANVIRRKRLLTILGELDDDEVALLNAYGRSYGANWDEDNDPWAGIEQPEPTHMGSNQGEFDASSLYDAGKKHLERLGLLSRSFPFVKRGSLPEFDTSEGDFKHSVEVSQLGRMLLREIGMPTPFDLENANVVVAP